MFAAAPMTRSTAATAWLALACGVAFVGVAALVLAGATAAIDDAVHGWSATLRLDAPVALARGLAIAGGAWGAIATVAVLAVALLLSRRGSAAVAIALATALAWLAMEAVKAVLERVRPLDRIDDIGGWSFPSGHATCAAAIGTVLWLGVRTWWTRTLAVLWVAAMAGSRLLLGVHWPSDVLGGLLLGTAVALAVATTVEVARRRRLASIGRSRGA